MNPSQLGPAQRADAVARMASQELDVLVIGGGVTGAGIALDAATRGLSVALVEASDYGSGTSSRSSKLIHGGLRYLEQGNIGLVREALRERSLLFELAPHLVRPVPFLFPLTRRIWERAYVGSGLLLYDSLGGARALPRHRHLTRRAALEQAPALRPDSLIGAVQYYDAQVDDARHTLTLVRTAARYGALVANSAEVIGFLRDGARVTGARVHDLEGGTTFEATARCVISATGVWTDDLQALAGKTAANGVRASKGVHLVVRRERIIADTGVILRTPTSVLFMIPWGDYWLIGTTDTDWSLDKAHPAATGADVDYLLDAVNRVLERPLTRHDVIGTYAGLRPLVASAEAHPSTLTREHRVTSPAPGLTAIAGGKLTTYRVMAKDAVDAAVADLDGVPASCTHRIRLLGADEFAASRNGSSRLVDRYGLGATTVDRLLGRYGGLTEEVLALTHERPQLARPLPGAEHYLGVEAAYAASHEGALHLDDVLTRRMHVSTESADRGLSAAETVAAAVAPVLGWDASTMASEVRLYRRRVDAEVAALAARDDAAAQAIRREAADSRG